MTCHKAGVRYFTFTESETCCLPGVILEDITKRHYVTLDSTFPAEGPKDGMEQP
jgi:hypothetical protein